MTSKFSYLNPYIGWLSELIPLNNYKKQRVKPNGDIQKIGKNPIHKEWNTKKYPQTPEQYSDWLANACNIGFRIGKDIFVFDLDPRNYNPEFDSEAALAKMLGYSDLDEALSDNPSVRTGGGGFHIYMMLPRNTDPATIKSNIKEIPGLDIKKYGGYVVAAGSRHPNGKFYEWCIGTDEMDICDAKDIGTLQTAEKSILDIICRDYDPNLKREGWGAYNSEQIRELFLDNLPIEEFGDNADWFPIMCACHHASAGEAVDEFVEWSLGDDKYSGDENIIRNRWESLWDKDTSWRAATLIMQIGERGHDTRSARGVLDFSTTETMEDFEDAEDSELLERATKMGRGLAAKKHNDIQATTGIDVSEGDEGVTRPEDTKAAIYISSLGAEGHISDEQVATAIRLIERCPSVLKLYAQNQLLKLLKPMGITKSDYNQIRKELMSSEEIDICNEITDLCLSEVFNNGKHIIYEPNGTIWIFDKTHWKEINKESLGKIMLNSIQSFVEHTGSKIDQMTMTNKSVDMMIIKSSVRTTKLFPLTTPKAIINCLNGEIHIREDGTHKYVEGHDPRSFKRSVIRCNYNPAAKSPLFDRTVEEIFAANEDPWAMIDYLGEIMGYMCQPNKNLGAWWLFHGQGGDGKTTITEILGHILGEAFKMTTSSAVAENGGREDTHFTADLVGALCLCIGDLKRGTSLNDERIKELADNKTITANPKGKSRFNFNYCAAPIICSNHLPKAPDNSFGFKRRANLVPFRGQFYKSGNVDPMRKFNIFSDANELSGVLNFMLEGLFRLRSRGEFTIPPECVNFTESWFKEANSSAQFAEECLEILDQSTVESDDYIPFKFLYESVYIPWTDENGYSKYRLSRKALVNELSAIGLRVKTGGGNVVKIYGVKVAKNFAGQDFDNVGMEEEEEL